MSIVTSTFTLGTVQIDGRRFVTEQHTDNISIVHLFEYLAAAGADFNALLAAHASQIANSLLTDEVAADVGSIVANGDLAVVTLNYAGVADVRNAVRDRYRQSVHIEAVAIGAYLSTFTDAQLKALFNLTDPQTAALRTKVNNALATWHDVVAEAGV